jgi:hypothetical protein
MLSSAISSSTTGTQYRITGRHDMQTIITGAEATAQSANYCLHLVNIN